MGFVRFIRAFMGGFFWEASQRDVDSSESGVYTSQIGFPNEPEGELNSHKKENA